MTSSRARKKAARHRAAWVGEAGQQWRRAWLDAYNENLKSLGFNEGADFWTKDYSLAEATDTISENSVRIEEVVSVSFERLREHPVGPDFQEDSPFDLSENFIDPPENFADRSTFQSSDYKAYTWDEIVARMTWIRARNINLQEHGFIQDKEYHWTDEDWTLWGGSSNNHPFKWPGAPEGAHLPQDRVPTDGSKYHCRTFRNLNKAALRQNPFMFHSPAPEGCLLSKLDEMQRPHQNRMPAAEIIEAVTEARRFPDLLRTYLCAPDATASALYWCPFWTPPRSQALDSLSWFVSHMSRRGISEVFESWLANSGAVSVIQSVLDSKLSIENPRLASRNIYEIHGLLEGSCSTAIPDTGAGLNTIDTAFAISRGYRIESDEKYKCKIRTLAGAQVSSDGLVRLKWSFEDDPDQSFDIELHAVKNSPHNVIFGMPFLQGTGTLTNHGGRIVRRTACNPSFPKRVCLQSTDTATLPRLRGRLGGREALALADSGSEVNVMSLRYAREHGYEIDEDSQKQEDLLFADGSQRRTVGKVCAPWQFSDNNESHLLVFEVLETCTMDLVIGQDFLFENDVFQKHAEKLDYHITPHKPQDYLYRLVNAVRLLPFFKRRKRKERPLTENDIGGLELYKELERRAKFDDLNSKLPDGPQKDDQIRVEVERRRAWHETQQRLHNQQSRHQDGASSTSSRGSSNSGNDSNITVGGQV